MRTVSFQGTRLSAGQRRRLEIERAVNGSRNDTVDWQALRDDINSRQFVGPPAPVATRAHMQHDKQLASYWRMANEFKRFGYAEAKQDGTPWVGDAFGYDQTV